MKDEDKPSRLHSPTVDDLDDANPPFRTAHTPDGLAVPEALGTPAQPTPEAYAENRPEFDKSKIDYDLCERLGMTREECERWGPGAGWSKPFPTHHSVSGDRRQYTTPPIFLGLDDMDETQLREEVYKHADLGEFFRAKAEHHRREANRWFVVFAVCCVLMLVALTAPTEWIVDFLDWLPW